MAKTAKIKGKTRKELRSSFFKIIENELDRAYTKHGDDQWSRHEFYAIMLEEVEECWADVMKNASQEQLMAEVAQVAAMCFRYAETRDRYREPRS